MRLLSTPQWMILPGSQARCSPCLSLAQRRRIESKKTPGRRHAQPRGFFEAKEKIVFSQTLDRVEGNAKLVRGNAIEEIGRLKEQPGKPLAIGGPNLASTILCHGLIDEYLLFVNPVLLGGGTPMFPVLDRRINLRLIETHVFSSGVVYLRYLNAYLRIKSGQPA